MPQNCLHNYCLLIFFLFFLRANAQEGNDGKHVISKKFIGVEDGLAAREAYCGLQDASGFIWFGTRNGLNRYDGKKFKLFTKWANKMQENNIVQLATDKQSQLFILYGYPGYSRLANGKVDVMNFQTDEVKTLSQAFPKLPFKEDKVYWIANDGTDKVNFMTFNPYQLWQYTPKDGFKLRCEMKDWDVTSYLYSVPTGPLNIFYNGYACIGFGHQSKYLLKEEKAIKLPEIEVGKLRPLCFNSNHELLLLQTDFDSKKNGFLRVLNSGEIIANKKSGITLVQPKDMDDVVFHPVANDTTSIFYLPNKGIYAYNNTTSIQVLSSNEVSDFANLSIYACFSDKLSNTWICTSSGVYKINIWKNKFVHYFTKEQQSIQTNNQARGIWQDPSTGNVYANVLTHFFVQQGNKTKAISTGDIKYALLPHKTNIYSTGYYLEKYEASKNKLTVLESSNTGRDILSAMSLNDSILLLGKMEGIYSYNIYANTINSLEGFGSSVNMPYRFLKRKDNSIWVVAENGLMLLNEKAVPINFYNTSTKPTGSFPIDNLTDVFEDDKGFVWITTNGDGLYKWNMAQNTFKHFSTTQGLPSNILYRIEEDNQHNFWISTEYGLCFLNPKSEVINNFFVKDGLSHNEFNRVSSYKAADGRLFFGGLNGVNAFYPEEIINDTFHTDVPLRIVSFLQYSASKDKLLDLTSVLLQEQKIVLNAGDKFFTLEFRLLDFEDKLVKNTTVGI